MIGTDIAISCFFAVVICLAAPGVDGTCCYFEQMQDDCSNMFHGEENKPLSCNLRTDFPSMNGACQIDVHNQEDGFQDRWLPLNQIQLFATALTWDAKCLLIDTNLEEDCLLHQRDSTFIALNVSFQLSGKDIHGVHFDLITLKGEDEPSVGSLEKSCHFLLLNNSLSGEVIGNRIFAYSGFVGLHPGTRYRLKATTLTNNGTYTAFDQEDFSVPDCTNRPKNNSDFFCNLPTPARWPSRILVAPDTFHVTFTIWPVDGVFDFYSLYLLNGHKKSVNMNNIIVRKDLKYVKNNVHYQDIDGVNSTVMRYTFGDADKMPPGLYSIAVLPQPDKACVADYHWGKRRCLFTLFPFIHDKHTPSTELSSLLSSAATEKSPTGMGRIIPRTSMKKRFDPTVQPTTPQQIIIFILLLVFLIICLVFICVWCCNLNIYHGNSIFSFMQDCSCGKNVNLDDRTVTSCDWLNRYEPVPLKAVIQGRLHCSHQSFQEASMDSTASCSDLENVTSL